MPQSAFGDKKTAGECDPPSKKNKAIRILKNQSLEEELRVIIHEVAHSAQWELFSEEFVDRFSTDLARLLVRLGYKKNEKTS